MNRETDLFKIKTIANELLNVPILETEYSPIIVSHPFTNCGIATLPDNNNFLQVDITQTPKNFEMWKSYISKFINNSESIYSICYLVNDAYRLMFFDRIANCLSSEDFSTLLSEIWLSSEYANLDENVSKETLLEHFKQADPSKLMTSSELEEFNNLDDTIIVYRGVGSKNKDNIKALSWTTSFGKAKWFAERWGKGGRIYSARINKNDIYAYFDRRNEFEVIVNFDKLQDIKFVKKPELNPQTSIKSKE